MAARTTIQHARYSITEQGDGWSVLKLSSGSRYTVKRVGRKLTCDCPDWRFRSRNKPGGCKHAKAVRALAKEGA